MTRRAPTAPGLALLLAVLVASSALGQEGKVAGIRSQAMKTGILTLLCAATLSLSVHAQDDMSSLAKTSNSELVAAARADANAYYAARKKAGKKIDFLTARKIRFRACKRIGELSRELETSRTHRSNTLWQSERLLRFRFNAQHVRTLAVSEPV
jgi:hypothetical protein